MGVRRKGRELAVQMLYQSDLTGQPMSMVMNLLPRIAPVSPEARAFAERLAVGTLERRVEVDSLIGQHSTDWRIERMATVDRSILRLAVFEYLATDAPKKVVINEALEVAKRFSGDEAVQFINGILDSVCRQIESESDPPKLEGGRQDQAEEVHEG